MSGNLVSILIPSYNRAFLMRETLSSLANQSYKNLECIIIDDGSTDDTKSIVADFVEKDKRFKLYERKRLPKGACTCRNIGIEHANGEYIMFLDSDDLITPYCLSDRLKVANNNPGFDAWVFPGLHFENKPGDSKLLWNITKKDKSHIKRFLASDIPWSTSGPLWKTATLKKYNIKWDENLADWQDADIHLRALLKGMKFYETDCLPDYFIRHTYESNSQRISASDFKEDRLFSKIKLFEKWHILIDNSNLTDKEKNEFNKSLSVYCFIFAERIIKKNINFDYTLMLQKMIEIYRHKFYVKILVRFYLWNLKNLENVFALRSLNFRIIRKCLPQFLFHTDSNFRNTNIDEQSLSKVISLMKQI